MDSATWDFFDSIVCLTNDEAEWLIAVEEFTRVGLYGRVRKFQARPDIGPHQSFSRSERRILIDFLGSLSPTLLHLEDDCVFRSLEHLPAAIAELPADWDVLYLGANLLCWNNPEDPQPERFSEHLFRVRQAWTTHAVAYNRRCVPHILENQVGYSEQMFDSWLSTQLPQLNAYVVAPMIAYQRQRVSSIWGTNEDYSPLFEASDAKLR